MPNEEKMLTKLFNELIEEKANNFSVFDTVTLLPNKIVFMEHLSYAIKNYHSTLTIFLIELKSFPHINNILDSKVTNRFLMEAAKKITETMFPNHFAARVGFNKFALFFKGEDKIYAEKYCYKLLDSLSQAFVYLDESFYLNPAIGISLYPSDGDSSEMLLSRANIVIDCLYNKKNERIIFYSKALIENTRRRLSLENDIRHGLEKDEFILYYQPQVSCIKGEIIGFEALIRWNSKTKGIINPGYFIPIAEDSGFIIELGKWVFITACTQAKKWESFNPQLKVAINISPKQFHQKDFYDFIKKTINDVEVLPNMIEIEITESSLIDNIDQSIELIKKLKTLGISIALDDFGTGYSSLMFLKTFPLDKLKIDQSFIKDITKNKDDAYMVELIIALAEHFKLSTIAEGVEFKKQLQLLKKFNCSSFQGYLFAKPMPEDEATVFLKNTNES